VSIPPGGAEHPFKTGTAHVETSTGVTVDVPLNPEGSTYTESPPIVTGALSWQATTAQGVNAVAIGGRFADADTNLDGINAVSLTITLTDDGVIVISTGGDCTLDFDEVSAQSVTGSFQCLNVSLGDGKGDVTGTFEAKA
jgi:hypothetical protein